MDEKILLLSDTHCRFDVFEAIVAYEMQINPGIKAILHCGDLGIYDADNLSTLTPRERHLIKKHNNPVHLFKPYLRGMRQFPLPTYAICGNHEDFALANELAAYRQKVANLHLFVPGEIIQIEFASKSLQVMGLGKILPVGCRKKRPRYIQEEELARALHHGRNTAVDILLSHEPILLQRESGSIFGSLQLSELIEAIRPCVFIAGHMHFEYARQIEDTQVFGLGYGLAGRYALMDHELNLTFKSLPPKAIELTPVFAVSQRRREQLTAENNKIRRSKKRNVQKLPVTGKEIVQKFQLAFGHEASQMVSRYFRELKTRLAATPDTSREQALALCEQFIQRAHSLPG